MKSTEKQLKTAAKELNEVLGLSPAINLKNPADVLKGIQGAIKLVTPEDEFTTETTAVLAEFKKTAKAPVAPTKGKAPKKVVEEPEEEEEEEEEEEIEEEEEEDEEEDEEDEEEEAPAPPKKGSKKVEPKAPAKNVVAPAKKDEKKEKGTGFVAAAYNRVDALCDTLKTGPKTIDEWSQKSDKLLVSKGGTANDKENKFTINYFYKISKHIDLGFKLPKKG